MLDCKPGVINPELCFLLLQFESGGISQLSLYFFLIFGYCFTNLFLNFQYRFVFVAFILSQSLRNSLVSCQTSSQNFQVLFLSQEYEALLLSSPADACDSCLLANQVLTIYLRATFKGGAVFLTKIQFVALDYETCIIYSMLLSSIVLPQSELHVFFLMLRFSSTIFEKSLAKVLALSLSQLLSLESAWRDLILTTLIQQLYLRGFGISLSVRLLKERLDFALDFYILLMESYFQYRVIGSLWGCFQAYYSIMLLF